MLIFGCQAWGSRELSCSILLLKKGNKVLKKNIWIPEIPVRLISPFSMPMAVVELQRKRWRVCVRSVLQCEAGKCQRCLWSCPEREELWAFNRGRADTLLSMRCWLPLFLVTAESWGNGNVSPRAAAASLYATRPSRSGTTSGAQLSASAISLSLWWLPWRDASRAVLSLLHPCSHEAVFQPWRFSSPWQFQGLGGRAALAGEGAEPLAREDVGKRLLTLKPPSALEMGLPSSDLPFRLPWAEVPRLHRTVPVLLGGLGPALVLPEPRHIYKILGNVGMECTGRKLNEGKWSELVKIIPQSCLVNEVLGMSSCQNIGRRWTASPSKVYYRIFYLQFLLDNMDWHASIPSMTRNCNPWCSVLLKRSFNLL